MTALVPTPVSGVVWRQLRPRLWVGRTDGEHLGTIERGGRFTATGTHGDAQRGYRTLQAAKAALTGEIGIVARPMQEPDARGLPAVLLACTTAAMVCAVALSTVGIAVLP